MVCLMLYPGASAIGSPLSLVANRQCGFSVDHIGSFGAEEIAEQMFAFSRQYRFRMELHSFDIELAVSETHNRPILRLRGDLQNGKQSRAIDNQRVVAPSDERIRQSRKYSDTAVIDFRSFPMHQIRRAHDI